MTWQDSSPTIEGHSVPATELVPATTVWCTPPAATSCYLSLVVPAYNEEKRLPASLEKIEQYLLRCDFSYELIVVDDGSKDNTRQVVKQFAATRPWVRLLHYDNDQDRPLNRGKGYAVRQGVLHAAGRDVLFSDSDLSAPIEEMEKLLPPISRGDFDLAFGSRALPASELQIHQPWYREWMGRTFNLFVQSVIGTTIQDTQCGFKAFRGEAAKQIFKRAKIDGFGFDTEVLFLAQKLNYRVVEVPVVWKHYANSRVNPILAPFGMMSELIQVRLNDIRGSYDDLDLEDYPTDRKD